MNKLKKGDNVQILSGKDKGKTGAIERMDAKNSKAMVMGANMYKRHVKSMGQTEGGIIEIAKPLTLSKLGLVCPSCKKVTRIAIKIEGDVKTRMCKKCGKEIK